MDQKDSFCHTIIIQQYYNNGNKVQANRSNIVNVHTTSLLVFHMTNVTGIDNKCSGKSQANQEQRLWAGSMVTDNQVRGAKNIIYP